MYKRQTINGGNISVTEYGTAAAIGGGAWADSGKILITGGTVDVKVYDGGDQTVGTGIGGGAEGYKGSSHIGEGGSADVSITGGTVTAIVKPDNLNESGAAIGSGQNKGGNIYIGGTAIVNAKTWVMSAAIGGGSGIYSSLEDEIFPPQNDQGNIIIEGQAQVNAETVAVDIGEPYVSGAGIGAGAFNHQQWNIMIKGNSKTTAKNGAYGAGIGGAYENINSKPVSVTISENAIVDASSDWFGAGIGTGTAQIIPKDDSIVTISGNANVRAVGGKGGYELNGGAGIGAGSESWIASIIILDKANDMVYAYYPKDDLQLIQYDIKNQQMLVKDKLNWITNEMPKINASNKTLTVGDTFDPLKGVTATDKEDGNLTGKIEVLVNDVNTSEAGVYAVTYKVTDSKGASITKTIYVTVNPRMEELNHVPTINASDKTLTVGDPFDPLKDVTAIDKEDGDLTKEIKILKNEVDLTKAGVYEITYMVTDSQGASVTKTIKVIVKDKDIKPNPDKNDVNTGDTTNLGFYASLLVISGLFLAAFVVWKKKKDLKNK